MDTAKHAVPNWGMKASMKAWMIKHWLYESVMELSAYLKIEAYEEAIYTCRIAYDVNRDLWLHDVIHFEDYKEIERKLNAIYNILMEVQYDCRTCTSVPLSSR